MPDDNIQVNDHKPDDGQVNDGQVDDNKDVAPQSDSEFMAETIDFIKDAKKSEPGDDADSDVGDKAQDSDSGVIPDLAGTDIPNAFADAAEVAGMEAADIIDMANKHTDEQLIEMIPTLQSSLQESDKEEANEQDDNTNKDEENKDIDPKLIESVTEKISKQLEEKFGTTLEEIDKFKAYQEEQSKKQEFDMTSKIFDEASKEFPVFGKTDELPVFPSGRLAGQLIPTSPAMKARLEVVRYADAFMGRGVDIDTAMANALATYKGLHLEKESQRKAIQDLKNHETKLSGARVGRETKKKYADTREEILDDIRQMKRDAGID